MTTQKVRGLPAPAKNRTELEALELAVKDQLTTIKFLEKRGNAKRRRIRDLEAQIIELGGTPN